jgi:hypothetical protein
MSEFTRHSDGRLEGRCYDRRRLVAAARQLFAQRGPNVTLSEIAVEAGIDADNSVCAGLAESLRAHRLGELIDLVRALHEPETQQVVAVPQPGAGWTESVREILLAHLERPRLSLRDVALLSPSVVRVEVAGEC